MNGKVSPHTLWETLKCIIRGETIKFSAIKKRSQNKQLLLLESKLNFMESRLAHCETNDKELLLTSINNTRNDLIIS